MADMTNPANWETGDLLEVIDLTGDYCRSFEEGRLYSFRKGLGVGGPDGHEHVSCYLSEGTDSYNSMPAHNFLWQSRPGVEK